MPPLPIPPLPDAEAQCVALAELIRPQLSNNPALVGIYMNRFVRTRTGSDITYLRFAFTGDLGMHHAQRHLDDGIVRSVWLSLDELKATEHLHRSPIVLESVGDYLAGQRYDIGLIHADASIYKVPQLTRPVPEEAGATLDDVLVQIH